MLKYVKDEKHFLTNKVHYPCRAFCKQFIYSKLQNLMNEMYEIMNKKNVLCVLYIYFRVMCTHDVYKGFSESRASFGITC